MLLKRCIRCVTKDAIKTFRIWNLYEIWIKTMKTQQSSFKKMSLKMSSGTCRPLGYFVGQGLICVCAQPMRDGVTVKRHLSLAGCIHGMIPVGAVCGIAASSFPPITGEPGGRFQNTYELLNPRALKISVFNKNHIFQRMAKIFCVEFQRFPLKFHTKYLTHTLKDVHLIHRWRFTSS